MLAAFGQRALPSLLQRSIYTTAPSLMALSDLIPTPPPKKPEAGKEGAKKKDEKPEELPTYGAVALGGCEGGGRGVRGCEGGRSCAAAAAAAAPAPRCSPTTLQQPLPALLGPCSAGLGGGRAFAKLRTAHSRPPTCPST